ncbi:hypothetical protein TVAG_351960 [Trichomonas vaginalis G3]|uniref:Uncharacterized protein n=1 Tax=Trichomonas vaginalis (strain ATCC PRA-98 / G3) TaxID=412133 RepID=A2DZT0_TRIV3|nr:hypothetical protein TVAGG3_0261530 [Trichomonas vaginalis G3]EAY14148.1 hypothetical protein TVAG_351960 [Trichomonas vaginalis G3]KAI5525158.1 hypothetical protein TVAGG3_0261530 [Trichomonas vaginalis G3]|eukprot:XP_001326371.1 hypothetical protein [Trichomonas vaginalis G3]
MSTEKTFEIFYPMKASPVKRKTSHFTHTLNPPLRTGFVDYQNPKKYASSPEPRIRSETKDFSYSSENKIKKPRKLYRQNIQSPPEENPNLFKPSKTPNFFIKTRDPPEFQDFTDVWGEYLELRHLKRIENTIYWKVYFKKWKSRYSQQFVQRIKQTSTYSNNSSRKDKDEINVNPYREIDTIDLIERARRTIDEMTSSSSWVQNAATSVSIIQSRKSSYQNNYSYRNESIHIGQSSLYPDQPKSPPVSYPNEHYIIPVDKPSRNPNRSLADSFSTLEDESDDPNKGHYRFNSSEEPKFSEISDDLSNDSYSN